MAAKTITSYIVGIFTHGGAATAGLASTSAAVLVGGLQFSELFATFKNQLNVNDFIVVVLIEIGFFMFYASLTLVNLATGLQAAKHENQKSCEKKKSYIQIDKLWRTIWKSLGVLFLTLMVGFLAIILSFTDLRMFFWWAIWFLIVFWLLANSYEFYSIGVNIERKYGKKPAIYAFADKILSIFEKAIIRRIDKKCASDPNEENK